MATEPTQFNPPPPGLYRAMARVLGPLEHALGLDCRTFMRLASGNLDRPLTRRERFVYRLHRLICGLCRRQDQQSRCLHELLGLAARGQKLDPETEMSAAAKEKLRRELEKVLPGE